MSIRVFLFFMLLSSAILWVGFAVILFNIDPVSASLLTLIIFYTTLFLALMSLLTVLGTWIRNFIAKKQLAYNRVRNSVRQSVLFALLLVVSAVMQSHEVLTWYNVLLFIVVLTILEFFFMSLGRQKNKQFINDPVKRI